MKLKRISLSVREVAPGRWLVKEWGIYYGSAARASRSVRSKLPENSILVLTWEPTTFVGGLAVDAILKAEETVK